MSLLSSQKSTTFVIFGLVMFLLMGIFGFTHFTMGMQMSGDVSDCPLMGITVLCTMDPLSHLTLWQGMFAVLPPNDSTSSLVFLLLSLSFIFALFFHSPRKIFPLSRLKFHPIPRFEYVPIKASLHEALASGILNPKTF